MRQGCQDCRSLRDEIIRGIWVLQLGAARVSHVNTLPTNSREPPGGSGSGSSEPVLLAVSAGSS
eukprot:3982106-Pleurochrysis_carterae.AAC.3